MKQTTKKRILTALLAMVMLMLTVVPALAAVGDDLDNLLFDDDYYASNNPDVVKALGSSHEAMLRHFLTHGAAEGRRPSMFFDAKWYLEHYPDLRNAFGSDYAAAYQHFKSFGISESRQASAEFSVAAYKANYSDLRAAFGDDNVSYFRHWVNHGRNEKRTANRRLSGTAAPAAQPAAPAAPAGIGEPVNLGDGFEAYLALKLNSKVCVNVQYAAANGNLVTDPYNGESNEIFVFHYVPASKAYYITPKHTNGKDAINNYGPNPGNGDQLRTFNSSNMSTDTHCLFQIFKEGGYYRIQCVGTGYWMDVDHGKTAAGTRINCYQYDTRADRR